MLRLWQDECITTALLKYQLGQTDFLAMATPGAGKTRMAAHLASRLFDLDKIDLVICFTPSISVTNSFQHNLEAITEKRMNGRMGSSGQVLTYHSLSFLSGSFWDVFREYRVFVIFDEIHHCGGHDINLANVWGEKILRNIRSRAAYTLALSGTPWRSDKLPIALARYSGDPSKLECDYIYSLAQAIHDGVCRIPKVVAIDNDQIRHTNRADEPEEYGSIGELLENTDVRYSDLLHHSSIVTFMLQQSVEKLQSIRQQNPQAAGLIVASSVHHAYWIKALLKSELDQSSIVVSHEDNHAHRIIEEFEHSDSQWIIAIGMISEGTNIPRLQLCCYLSRIKTELYFRQVLGRIVRSQQEKLPFAYMYILAEDTLLTYAKSIGDDLPEHLATVELNNMQEETHIERDNFDMILSDQQQNNLSLGSPVTPVTEESLHSDVDINVQSMTEEGVYVADQKNLSLSGQFYEELIMLQHAFHKAC